MSYLHTPRIHFSGQFQADPSTINNNNSNFDPTVQFTEVNSNGPNTWVYWNPNGTHNWDFVGCSVRGVGTATGLVTSDDPLIGAAVLNASRYKAKIVDLDPDNQAVSQIWGLQVQIAIKDPNGNTQASVTGTLPATAFADLWNRSYLGLSGNQIGMPTMSAVFQNVLTNVQWQNASLSPLLSALQKISPDSLSIRFTVDSYQPGSNQENFTLGRISGTVGPAFADDPPRSTPRRLAPVQFWGPLPPPAFQAEYFSPQGSGGIFSNYGAVGALVDTQRSVLVLDLGNCVPTQPTAGSPVSSAGWPVISTTFDISIPNVLQSPVRLSSLKSGGFIPPSATVTTSLGQVAVTTDIYLGQAGIVEVEIPQALLAVVEASPLTLTVLQASPSSVPEAPFVAAQEDNHGLYVDVSQPFFRLNPGLQDTVTLIATRFGQPWSGATLTFQKMGVQPASNGPATTGSWNNSDPQDGLTLSAAAGTTVLHYSSGSGDGNDSPETLIVSTGTDGTAQIVLHSSDPGNARMYTEDGPDGQVYWVTLQAEGATSPQIFNMAGAPINALVFSGYTPKAMPPTWDDDVGPILSRYARTAPYMKSIIDLGDYATVQMNSDRIAAVLSLPPENPHHMPITRDLSRAKLAVILQWIKNGMPKSSTAQPLA